MPNTLKIFILLFLMSGIARADCYEGRPFCFGNNQKRLPIEDGIAASSKGDAFLKKHPNKTWQEIHDACRSGELDGPICKIPKAQ